MATETAENIRSSMELMDQTDEAEALVKTLVQMIEENRQAEREHTLSLKQGQRYALRELRVLFNTTEDENLKAQINILERAFRGIVTVAVNKELNRIRRNGITGQNLFAVLRDIYSQHNMREWLNRSSSQIEEQPVPRIICSESFV